MKPLDFLFKNTVPIPLFANERMGFRIKDKLIQRHELWWTEEQIQVFESFGKKEAFH